MYDHVDVDITRRSCPILYLDVKPDDSVYRRMLKQAAVDPLRGNITK